MIDGLRQKLKQARFEPFTIIMNSGRRYEIPTAKHAHINPQGNRVMIWFHDGGGLMVSTFHIAAVEETPPPKPRKRRGK